MATRRTRPQLSDLSVRDQTIIELFAVFFYPVPRSTIARGVGLMKVWTRGRTPPAGDIEPVLDALTEAGWLETDGSSWSVPAELSSEVIGHAQEAGRFEREVDAVRRIEPAEPSRPHRRERDARLDLYAGKWSEAEAALPADPQEREASLARICEGFGPQQLYAMPDHLRASFLTGLVADANLTLASCDGPLELLVTEPELTPRSRAVAVENLALRGRLEEARALLDEGAPPPATRGLLAFVEGDVAAAVTAFDEAPTAKGKGRRPRCLDGLPGLMHPMALLAVGTLDATKRAKAIAHAGARRDDNVFRGAHATLEHAADVLLGNVDLDDSPLYWAFVTDRRAPPLARLVQGLACAWALPKSRLKGDVARNLADVHDTARKAGYIWVAGQAARLALAGAAKDGAGRLAASVEAANEVDLLRAVKPPERWAEALDALSKLAQPKAAPTPSTAAEEGDRRLVWVVRKSQYGNYIDEVEPREQIKKKSGWTKGRRVALERLYTDPESVAGLSETDRAVCRHIEEHVSVRYGRYHDVSYGLDAADALEVLAGHPLLFAMKGEALIPAEVQVVTPTLRTKRTRNRLRLSLEPMPPRGEARAITRIVAAGRYKLVRLNETHQAVARILGRKGLDLPAHAEPRLAEILAGLSDRITVEREDAAPETAHARSVQPDPNPSLVLRPFGAGMSVEPAVRPLGPKGPTGTPGRGPKMLMAAVDGEPLRTERDLDEERAMLDGLLARLPGLDRASTEGGRWQIEDRDAALELLGEIRAEGVSEVWAEGAPIELTTPVTAADARVVLRDGKDGFVLSGELAAGDAIIPLDEVFDYLSASPSRFLSREGQARVVALSRDLRARLDELAAFGRKGKAGFVFHPLHAPLLDELTEGTDRSVSEAFRERVERLRGVGAEPEVPLALQAELRPYQQDGFRWLARLTRIGLGACLADDMGLGKTVQTIAALLDRAEAGPALVVAPTSVLSVWVEQLARFAPTLQPRLYAGPDRTAGLADLGPFDVLIASYTVLQLDIDALEDVPFAAVVLDEAQAIKNPSSQRAKAARRLQAGARIATTGTPVENRLEELHSLMSFLNPGLLGSQKAFREGFVRPVERGDRAVQDRLRRVIRPFLLRRTKAEVLEELPPKTEVSLRVALSEAEIAAYEVIRRKALEALPEAGDAKGRRMHILAALTRLRRAACSPRIVGGEAVGPSTKLVALDELLEDLLPGRHRALVFSQFVDHLALVREHLEARGVTYQYLDGSTPARDRKAAVDAFQAGRGSVFLISLRAGGVGLDLTGADYVIHLDPWWNPAVEDQASDRVHRIGQRRPVTVYRIIAQDTVEDRILALHHKKRALAEALLDGTDAAGAMSEEELLELLQAV